MRDFKLLTPTEDDWYLDIDVLDGQASLLEYASQTNDQRAAIATYLMRGTVPGALTVGVDWGSLYEPGQSNNESLVGINDQIQKQMQEYIAVDNGLPTSSYQPMFVTTDEGMAAFVFKGELS